MEFTKKIVSLVPSRADCDLAIRLANDNLERLLKRGRDLHDRMGSELKGITPTQQKDRATLKALLSALSTFHFDGSEASSKEFGKLIRRESTDHKTAPPRVTDFLAGC